jgi:hypothetical protein
MATRPETPASMRVLSTSHLRGAAAVAWAISEANQLSPANYVREWFGLRSGVSQRAEPMLHAIGVDRAAYQHGHPTLGAPDLLLSSRRDGALADFGFGRHEQ